MSFVIPPVAGYVVSLPGYEPPPRYDGIPWTQAEIAQAAVSAGPFTVIDTITLDPVDTDPANPQSRDFTTTEATLPAGWVTVTFRDATGNPAPPSTPRSFPDTPAEPQRPLVDLQDLKTDLKITRETSDASLVRIIAGVTTTIERLTGKRFTPTPALASSPPAVITVPVNGPPPARSFPFGPASFGMPLGPQAMSSELAITIPHASEITALSLDPTGILAPNQYTLESDSTLPDPYTRRVVILDPAMLPAQTLTVTGRFGIVPPPADLVDAAIAMCARRYKERDASWGDTVQMPDGGLVSYYRSLPPTVRLTIDSYCEVTM